MFKYPVIFLFLSFSLIFFFSCEAPTEAKEEINNDPPAPNVLSPKMLDEEEATEAVEAEDVDGNIEYYFRRTSDFAKNGQYRKYNPNKKLIQEAFYVNDTLHLYRIFYYEATGDTQIVETLDMGDYDGPFKSYYENGQLELLGNYINNVASGEWKKYYDTGELMEVVMFANNKENGPFTEYYRNGNIKTEGNYNDGDNEHGELKMYNEDGVLIRIMDCKNGICKTTWKAKKQPT